MEEITTPNPATGGDPVAEAIATATDPAPAGQGADGSGNSISLEALQEVLGKDFKDVDGALKSIKDTYSYVGSQAQFKEQVSKLATALNTDEAGVLSTLENLIMDINNPNPSDPNPAVPAVDPVNTAPADSGFVTRAEMDEQNFFSENKSLSDLKDVLRPIKEAFGKDMSWSDFANTEQAQKVIAPITGYREIEQQKSVLESNPRLGAVTDTMSKARESMAAATAAANAGDRQTAVQQENAARESAVAGVIDAYDLK